MPVFISHRTADDQIANRVALRLKSQHGIQCYVDDIDAELRRARGTAAVSTLIVDRLNKCTNLLAIVTPNTAGSWWVPFEVGVARQAPRVITSFSSISDKELPEFLLEWPRLRGETAVDTFAQLYKSQRGLLEDRVILRKGSSLDQTSTVEQFQTRLKSMLGQ